MKQAPIAKGHPILGIIPKFTRDSLNFMLDVRQYGDFVEGKFGPFPVYFLNHPDLIHQVLVSDADKYYKSRIVKQVLAPGVGNGIFTSDGDFWRRQRKLVQPAFHTRRVANYAEVMVQYTVEMLERWQQGQTLAIDHEMTALTLRIVNKTLFDADVSQETDEISATMTTLLTQMDKAFNDLIPVPMWLPTQRNRDIKRTVAHLNAIIQRIISERRSAGDDRGDLLSMLLLAQAEDNTVMTDKQVSDEAKTLFGAGHETTAVTMTWTLYLLSQHPEIAQKLHEEVDTALAGRLPTFDDLAKMPYTEWVIKESMRLYPPAWGTSREPIVDTLIGDYPVKKGNVIMINIYGMHRDARFFDNPDAFIPERFSPENEKHIPRYAYLPFGAGPRVCIGNAFAMMEARLLLATIAQRFALALAPGHVVQPERVFTLRPRYGMKMVVAEREAVMV